MSDAQKLIADVHRVHVYDVRSPAGLHQCECGYVLDDDYPDMVPHISAEIDKALGGLTKEWATEFDSWYRNPRGEKRDYVEHFDYKGDEHSARDHVRTSKGVRLVTCFVSGWTVTE